MKTFFKIIGIIILVSVFIYFTCWSVSHLECEYLTNKYRDQFVELEGVKDASLFRIIYYTGEYAEIYVVNFKERNGMIHKYKKKDGKWEYFKMGECIWADYGSADDTIWPYGR